MKLVYITNARIPTEKAHGLQIIKTCEAFADKNVKLSLLIPMRKNNIKEDPFSFYGVKENFNIEKIKSFDFLMFSRYLGRISFWLQSFFFLIKLIFKKVDRDAIIYTRTPEITWLFKKRGYRVVFEAHNWPQSKVWLYKKLLKKVDKIVCNSKGTAKRFNENDFINTIIAPNGVDLEKFEIEGPTEREADLKLKVKKELGLPINKKMIMYIGHFYKWKGIDVMIDAANSMTNRDGVLFVFIGGLDKDTKKYKQILNSRKLKNVILYGYKKRDAVLKFLKCADILLLPNISISEESVEFTSPIKMFEYMASKKPIVASDLPSIKEVLNEYNAVLFKAGDPIELVNAIDKVSADDDLAKKLTEQAYQDVQKFTWKNRVQTIINFIKT